MKKQYEVTRYVSGHIQVEVLFLLEPCNPTSPDNTDMLSSRPVQSGIGGCTFSFHTFDSIRTKAITVYFLFQVKSPFPLDLIVRDPIIMVTSPCPRPLGKEDKEDNLKPITDPYSLIIWCQVEDSTLRPRIFCETHQHKICCFITIESKCFTIMINKLFCLFKTCSIPQVDYVLLHLSDTLDQDWIAFLILY